MNLYTAAVCHNRFLEGQYKYLKLNDVEKQIIHSLPNVLESYFYIQDQNNVDSIRNSGVKIFLDSGAFSAFTLGAVLSIEEYCNYIKTNIDIIRRDDTVDMFSVLDSIGNAEETYKNQKHMEYLGCRPIPCFHSGEPEEYLQHYVENYSYIALGGLVGGSAIQLTNWLDGIWEKYLIDGSGNAKIKVHGFGITREGIMAAYPWHSVDSSSWVQKASFGGIMHPTHGHINVSNQNTSKHTIGQHLSNMAPVEQHKIMKDLEESGFTYERLSVSTYSRAAYNLQAYNIIGKNIKYEHKSIIKQGLF